MYIYKYIIYILDKFIVFRWQRSYIDQILWSLHDYSITYSDKLHDRYFGE